MYYSKPIRAILYYLSTREATATEISVALRIYRPSVCRYKRQLEKAGLIMEIGKCRCRITGHQAARLTRIY